MHDASKKKQRKGSNPKVNVRLNVRPLRNNWKPVKLVECDGAQFQKTKSPAEDQLDPTVWKTKNVRTDVVKAVAVEDQMEVKTLEQSPKRVPGLVGRCDCASCERADEVSTASELSPHKAFDDLYLEKKKRLANKKGRRVRQEDSRSRRRHHHRLSLRSISTPPPAPPNSVVSHESQQTWSKLYDEVRRPTKIIDLKKIPTVPGQIGMSELEPEAEEPTTPPPTAVKEENPRRSPGLPILKAPPVSPPSFTPEPIYNFPPPPPVVKTPEEEMKPIPPGSPMLLTAPGSIPADSLILLPPSSPAVVPADSNISMIRKMERLFYGSESNWWLLVALFMLTIFAYRSSIEQHTCYYD